MEIQNPLKSSWRTSEGAWTPEKAGVTWRSTFTFQIRKRTLFVLFVCLFIYLFTLYLGYVIQCAE